VVSGPSKLARAGKSVEIEPRQVEIKELELIKFNFPEVELVANVSSGTYIRVLVEDIASNLDTSAYTTQLRRTTVGKYGIDKATLGP
jgi:tRNA pseudouridine55 synthase